MRVRSSATRVERRRRATRWGGRGEGRARLCEVGGVVEVRVGRVWTCASSSLAVSVAARRGWSGTKVLSSWRRAPRPWLRLVPTLGRATVTCTTGKLDSRPTTPARTPTRPRQPPSPRPKRTPRLVQATLSPRKSHALLFLPEQLRSTCTHRWMRRQATRRGVAPSPPRAPPERPMRLASVGDNPQDLHGQLETQH